MKYGFIIPILDEYDVQTCNNAIEKACSDCGVDYEIIFALNSKLNAMFTKVRNDFIDNKRVKGFMVDRPVDQYKLITLAMEKCEDYDATVIYSAKEEVNVDVVKAFVTSHQAGNKIVYLKKVFRGFKKITEAIKSMFYKMGIKIVGVFKDINAETDIQLLDNDVVKTINQLPGKNRQLRTLDSLLYYTTDTIHLEVDSKAVVNPNYTVKDKQYVKNAVVAYTSLVIALVCVAISIIALSINWKMHFVLHLVFWFVFAIGVLLAIVFNTRKTLSYRAGTYVEPSEYVALKDKIEYYNM